VSKEGVVEIGIGGDDHGATPRVPANTARRVQIGIATPSPPAAADEAEEATRRSATIAWPILVRGQQRCKTRQQAASRMIRTNESSSTGRLAGLTTTGQPAAIAGPT